MSRRLLVALALLCALARGGTASAQDSAPKTSQGSVARTVLAGGCFWCMEDAFESVPGVVSVVSGYTGGRKPNPTYEEVSAGNTGHYEVVEITYDPSKVTYAQLLEHFWRNIDPTVDDRQFCDIGDQYRAAIFYGSPAERKLAEDSRRAIEQSKKFPKVFTGIIAAAPFYVAEEYHQDYYRKNPIRYNFYKHSCGRAQRLKELWGNK
jgi:peptide-methionine (S)-S-oxide reductase